MNVIVARLSIIVCVSLIAINLILTGQSSAKLDPKNIAGMWLFDEGTGNVVVDSSGNGNDGELMNGPQRVDGKFGSALAFDGKDDYVNVPHSPTLQITDTVSISVWVKRPRLELDLVLEKGGDWTTGECNYGMGLHSVFDNMFYFFFQGGWRGTPGVTDKNWHHYAIIATNGDENPSLYVDGVKKPVKSKDGAGTITLFPSFRDFHIGAQVEPQWKYYSANIIDEVAIFNAALIEDDIKNLMKGLSFVLAVSPSGKLATAWARVKKSN